MHKLTARTIVDASAALIKLGEKELKKQGLTLKLARTRRAFITEAREIEERRRHLEQEYAETDPGSSKPTGDITDVYEYNDKLKELFDTEIELAFESVPIAEFGEKFPWSANVLDPLLFAGIVTGPEEPKAAKPKEDDSALAEPAGKTADEES